jgi:hypothetical protein
MGLALRHEGKFVGTAKRPRGRRCFVVPRGWVVALLLAGTAAAAQDFRNADGSVRLHLDTHTGRFDIGLGDRVTIRDAYGGVQLDTYVRTIDCPQHAAVGDDARDALGTARRVEFVHRRPGLTLTQRFLLYDAPPCLTVELLAESGADTDLGATWIGPLVVDGAGDVDLGPLADPRALRVPYDNDAWSRYVAGTLNRTDTSHEVAAFYDADSRHGLIVGAVSHDTWKNGIFFQGHEGRLDKLNAFGGAADAASHDSAPHGRVSGRRIASERFRLAACDDWRDGLEQFADANALLRPALPWGGGVPFGWNSWGKIGRALTYDKAAAVAQFLHDELLPRGFANDGTLYVNLDSYWDNLSAAQLRDFVQLCRRLGLKPGIYWAPFVYWGDNLARRVDGGDVTWREVVLTRPDGTPLKLDGGYALDATHPAVQARIARMLARFSALHIAYVKLDFLSHAALEGRHFDPAVQTGVQAYHHGMSFVLAHLDPGVFVSLSIAPLFPHGYGHARRAGCDAFGSLQDTEYTLNNLGYGWWASGRLYRFTDPDHLVLQGFSPAEQRSRVTSGAMGGTVLLNGDDLSAGAARPAVLDLLTRGAILDVARLGRAFRPVEGRSDEHAPDTFVLEADGRRYVAVFNLARREVTRSIDVRRCFAGGAAPTAWRELWDGGRVDGGAALDVTLPPAGCALYQAE